MLAVTVTLSVASADDPLLSVTLSVKAAFVAVHVATASAVTAPPAETEMFDTVTVKTGKQAFYRQLDLTLDEAYAYTARVMTENLLTRDAEEGIAAFIAKRPPQWTDVE